MGNMQPGTGTVHRPTAPPVRWIVDPGGAGDEGNVNKIIYTIQELGLEVVSHNYRPFGGTEYHGFYTTPAPTVFYGSLNYCRDAQKRGPKIWHPFAWNNWNALRCQSYYAYWGKFLMSPLYGFFPYGELSRLKDFIYKTYSDFPFKPLQSGAERIFIKPDENDKLFTGQLVAMDRLEDWMKIEHSYGPIDPASLCVVAKPVDIAAEYRFVIADRKALTGSQYRADRALEVSPEVSAGSVEFAEKVASSTEWEPHPIYVMDIAKMSDGEFRLIEIGSVNCAGYYAMNIRLIVEKMSEIALREWAKS
jgi:hypothetical protein